MIIYSQYFNQELCPQLFSHAQKITALKAINQNITRFMGHKPVTLNSINLKMCEISILNIKAFTLCKILWSESYCKLSTATKLCYKMTLGHVGTKDKHNSHGNKSCQRTARSTIRRIICN